MFFIIYFWIKNFNISLIKHLLTSIYFGLWWIAVDIFWLLVGGGGWWWIFFSCGEWWWVVVDIFWLVVGGVGSWRIYLGWWWVVVDTDWWLWEVEGGGIVLSNLLSRLNENHSLYFIWEKYGKSIITNSFANVWK